MEVFIQIIIGIVGVLIVIVLSGLAIPYFKSNYSKDVWDELSDHPDVKSSFTIDGEAYESIDHDRYQELAEEKIKADSMGNAFVGAFLMIIFYGIIVGLFYIFEFLAYTFHWWGLGL